MMKAAQAIIETGADLIEIFIKHPVKHFPVLKKNKIIGYLSKKKILRLSTNREFLDKSISVILPEILEEIDHDLVLGEIEKQNIKPIPYLLWSTNRLEIHKKNKEDFFLKHKPVGHVTKADITAMIEGHQFPMAAFDGSGNLLLENGSAQMIRNMTGLNSPNPFLCWIKQADLKPAQTSSRKPIIGKKTYQGFKSVYHVQQFKINQGIVNFIIFLSFQKKNP